MMKNILYIVLLLFVNTAIGQVFSVASGTVSLGSASTLSLNETSLSNNGNFVSANGSTVNTFSSDITLLKGLNPLYFNNLIIRGNISLETDLNLYGNIILSSGLINLNNSELHLGGQIIGENSSNYVYSEGSGEIIKIVDLIANQKTDLGFIGLEIMAHENITQAEFRRGHSTQSNGSAYSIARYFKLPQSDNNFSVSFNFLDPELNSLDAENLTAFVFLDNVWQPVNSYPDADRTNYIHADLMKGVEMITLFESVSEEVEIIIPGGISPNGDDQNDIFIIPGINNYPDNKLVIFNRWGEILLEEAPYENDWGGENENGVGVANDNLLPDGTYFYIFFKDKNNKNSVLKGSFEIKIGI